MKTISFDLNFDFRHKICIEYVHGSILAHDKLVTLLYQARESLLNTMDLSESNIFDNVLLTTSIHVNYLGIAFLNNEINIKLSLNKKGKATLLWKYSVINNSQNDELIAEAESTSVCYSMEYKKIVRPEKLLSLIMHYTQQGV